MAYCKIHAIRAAVGAAVDYICNEAKTEGKMLISSHDCQPETAAEEFAFSLSKTSSSDPNKAYHLIQSFLPGETTPEIAHTIGNELASRILGENFSYIVATHTDRNHLHNHIVFCAADNVHHRKYHDCKRTYYRIRNTSDELCAQHDLSVITDSKNLGATYKEWTEEKKGASWKSVVKKDINAAVKKAATYDDFLRIMKEQGYQIRGENLNAAAPKYISFLPPGKDRWIRGKETTLGPDFTRESINRRIESGSAMDMNVLLHPENDRLIQISDEKLADSPYLKRWADQKNLQIASAAYTEIKRAGFSSLEDLSSHIAMLRSQISTLRDTAREADRKMSPLAEIIRYAEQYTANLPYKLRYEKAKDPDRYFRKHESEISLCEGAMHILKKAGIDPATIDLDELRQSYAKLNSEKSEAITKYKQLSDEQKELERLQKTMDKYIQLERKEPERTDNNDTLT